MSIEMTPTVNDYKTLDSLELYDGILDAKKERLTTLKTALSQSKLSLVLGAGINSAFGLPGWNGLLSKCFGYSLSSILYNAALPNDTEKPIYLRAFEAYQEKNTQEVYEILNSMNSNDETKRLAAPGDQDVLEKGQYFYNCLNKFSSQTSLLGTAYQQNMFMNTVRKSLTTNKTLKDADGELFGECVELITNQRFPVREIITYNFDALLEAYLSEYKSGFKFKSHVNSESPDRTSDVTDIYHVHGRISTEIKPSEKEDPKFYEQDSDKIIFAEESYYEIERYPYDWRNVIQAKALLEKTCLFIGFSGEDYNFRRILKQMVPHKKNTDSGLNKYHYIFICLDSQISSIIEDFDNKYKDKSHEEKNSLRPIVLKILLNYYMELKECYLGTFGILPIWTTYRDIVTDVKSLIPETGSISSHSEP